MEQDMGASGKPDRAVVNGAASVSALRASVPSAARAAVQKLANTEMCISMNEWNVLSNDLIAAADRAEEAVYALEWLVCVIDKAGLLNLSNGVQLGQASWLVKASDALDYARRTIAAAQGIGAA